MFVPLVNRLAPRLTAVVPPSSRFLDKGERNIPSFDQLHIEVLYVGLNNGNCLERKLEPSCRTIDSILSPPDPSIPKPRQDLPHSRQVPIGTAKGPTENPLGSSDDWNEAIRICRTDNTSERRQRVTAGGTSLGPEARLNVLVGRKELKRK